MLFSDYKQNVILDYHEKKKNLLSLNLAEPSPATLKKECLLVLSGRFHKKDEKTLRLFFEITEESTNYHQAIEWFKTDKFKPLVNFLKGYTADTEKKNIELLAWLIDFKYRPYEFGGKDTEVSPGDVKKPEVMHPNLNEGSNSLIESNPSTAPSSTLTEIQGPSISTTRKKWPVPISLKRSIPTAAILFLLTGGLFLYIYWESTKVYICSSGTASKYHLNHNCPTLGNCKNGKNDVVSITRTEAEKRGKTLCKFEIH
ncbi:hypothetical protein [Pedobacter psychroterrae]|uniref:Uncharacterized protein n=1 Tax=Pedobacter psychroterrae TaxID=2530453 RepID=A0A4R0NIA6_9SPHI|nr:hypothetical protein [Pedobacter psychroterrae]TCC99958.1 hypothetical protein EZ437_17110 [Pedobacter psychroterrae]